MTRGSFYLITDKYIVASVQFNGDMYLEGHGLDAIKMLSKVKTLKEFKATIEEFNKDRHQYEEQLTYPEKRSYYITENNVIDFNENYFSKFNSDWTFWKNVSTNDVTFLTRDKGTIILKPNKDIAINYGYLKEKYNSKTKRKK